MKYPELSGKMFDILKICEIEYLIFGVNWDKNGHKFSCSTQPEIADGFPPIEMLLLLFSVLKFLQSLETRKRNTLKCLTHILSNIWVPLDFW